MPPDSRDAERERERLCLLTVLAKLKAAADHLPYPNFDLSFSGNEDGRSPVPLSEADGAYAHQNIL
jgi:hypothetical protein